MKRVLIFGSNSTLAKKIKSFLKNDYLVTEVAKKKINFSKKNSPSQIHKVLSKVNPDIVINFGKASPYIFFANFLYSLLI